MNGEKIDLLFPQKITKKNKNGTILVLKFREIEFTKKNACAEIGNASLIFPREISRIIDLF